MRHQRLIDLMGYSWRGPNRFRRFSKSAPYPPLPPPGSPKLGQADARAALDRVVEYVLDVRRQSIIRPCRSDKPTGAGSKLRALAAGKPIPRPIRVSMRDSVGHLQPKHVLQVY